MWYNEIRKYNYNKPGFSMGMMLDQTIDLTDYLEDCETFLATGHFTQVVWKDTRQLGCGLAINRKNKVYGVCDYSPPGNYEGKYKENVLRSRSG